MYVRNKKKKMDMNMYKKEREKEIVKIIQEVPATESLFKK